MAQPFEVDAGQKHGPGGVDGNEIQLASPFRSLVSGHLRSRAVRLDSHEPLMIRSEARTGGPFPGRSVRHARCERMRPLACSEPLDDRFGPVGQSDTIVLSDLARVQAAPLDDLTARTTLRTYGIASRELPRKGPVPERTRRRRRLGRAASLPRDRARPSFGPKA